MESLTKNPELYLQIFGNFKHGLHFLAVRFKKPILNYRGRFTTSSPVEIPEHSIVLFHGPCPPFRTKPSDHLIYTTHPHERLANVIVVPNPSEKELLSALFSMRIVHFSCFHKAQSVLYLITQSNPFKEITEKCRKDKAFQALLSLARTILLEKRALSLQDVALMRHFKRNEKLDSFKKFNTWYFLASEMSYDAFKKRMHRPPSAQIGQKVFQILKRSERIHYDEAVMPLEFYDCEVLLTDAQPVGVQCYFNSRQVMEYVSPMVVSDVQRAFSDSSRRICNAWFPLYKNSKSWNDFGLSWYATRLKYAENALPQILRWLRMQTVEKYQLFYKDLSVVGKILLGQESRWSLKN